MIKEKQVVKLINNTISTQIKLLTSNENLNKNGNRVLISDNDPRHKSIIGMIKGNASLLEGGDTEKISSLVYNGRKELLDQLRDHKLLKETIRNTSIKRSKFDLWHNGCLREGVKLGIIEEHPLKPNLYVLVDKYATDVMKKNKEEPRKAFLKVGSNVSFHSWFDDVVMAEKIVKS